MDEICQKAGLPYEYLVDQNNWVSVTFERNFMRVLREHLQKEELAFEVGKMGASKELLGRTIYFLFRYVLTFNQICLSFPKYMNWLNKVVKAEMTGSSERSFTFRLTPVFDGLDVDEKTALIESMPDALNNIAGYLSNIPKTTKGLPEGRVAISKNDGDDHSYTLQSYQSPEKSYLKGFIPIIIPGLIFFPLRMTTEMNLDVVALWSMIGCLSSVCLMMLISRLNLHRFIKESEDVIKNLDGRYRELSQARESLSRRLQESRLINEITQQLVRVQSEEQIVRTACESVVSVLEYDRAFIMLADPEKSLLSTRYVVAGANEEFRKMIGNFKLSLNIESTDPVKFTNVFKYNRPALIADVSKHILTLQDEESKKLLLFSRSDSFICVPIATNQHQYGVFVCDCLTQSKQLTEQDLELLTTVGNQVAMALERQHALLETIEAYKQSDRLKDQFLANTTHELRTPLNGIVGIAEGLLHGASGPITPESRKNLQLVIDSGNRLSSLVDDILSAAKIKHGSLGLHIDTVSARHISLQAVQLAEPLAQKKGLKIVNEINDGRLGCKADPDRLNQILNNLIGNAIKFTEKGSITLSAKQVENKLQFTVTDTGIGIAKEHLEKLFTQFFQADADLTRRYGGVGLGLSITRELIRLQHGEIWVDSLPGAGTSVHFTLPFQSAKEFDSVLNPTPVQNLVPHDQPAQIETVSTFEKAKVLVVDDEPINLQVLVNHLNVEGYDTRCVSTGREAVDLIANGFLPDLILLDVMMPLMNGYDVCREIRKTHSSSTLPIIFLTAKTQDADIVEGLSSGGNDYIRKPLSRVEVLARINTHLASSRLAIAYSRFVPFEKLELLSYKSILDVRTGDSAEREMSIVFSDIRHFTALCETMPNSDVYKFLNSYFGRLAPIIEQHHGIIDKFIGDCIMAIFKTPQDALVAGIELQRALIHYNVQHRIGGRRIINSGVGIHTGSVIFGPVGYNKKLDITVLSDSVNVASRLEGVSKEFGANIVISREVLDKVSLPPELLVRQLGRQGVKGRNNSVQIFEVLDTGYAQCPEASDSAVAAQFYALNKELMDLKIETKIRFEEGVSFFQSGHYEKAIAKFKSLEKQGTPDLAIKKFIADCEAQLQNVRFGKPAA